MTYEEIREDGLLKKLGCFADGLEPDDFEEVLSKIQKGAVKDDLVYLRLVNTYYAQRSLSAQLRSEKADLEGALVQEKEDHQQLKVQ